MRKAIIVGSVLAVVGFVPFALASDHRNVSEPNAVQTQRTASDDSRGERHHRYERSDRSRERHHESGERRRESRETHDESHERRDHR